MVRVLVMGGGLIGCGWAAAFAGGGHDVVVCDPDPDVARRLDDVWRDAQPVMARLGTLRADARTPRHETSAEGLAAIDLVQEALPEDLGLKRRVLAGLEPQLGADTLLASSSSSLPPEEIAQGLRHPERAFVAHPCNPPYLMPTVELVGHGSTPDEVLDRAEKLYAGMGKTVLRMARPMRGHLVNRLQFALWREAVHLVQTGAATMTDIEKAVTEGLAPRWCLMGPGGVFHLSGGDDGMAGYLAALGDATQAMWSDLGTPDLKAAAGALIAGMNEADPRSVQDQAEARDRRCPR